MIESSQVQLGILYPWKMLTIPCTLFYGSQKDFSLYEFPGNWSETDLHVISYIILSALFKDGCDICLSPVMGDDF